MHVVDVTRMLPVIMESHLAEYFSGRAQNSARNTNEGGDKQARNHKPLNTRSGEDDFNPNNLTRSEIVPRCPHLVHCSLRRSRFCYSKESSR